MMAHRFISSAELNAIGPIARGGPSFRSKVANQYDARA